MYRFCFVLMRFFLVRGLHISEMQRKGRGVHLKRVADKVRAALYGVVKAAHVAANGDFFNVIQLKEISQDIDAFFSMTIWVLVLNRVAGNLLPLASSFIFDITGTGFVKVRW